jgi:hypothetical protein
MLTVVNPVTGEQGNFVFPHEYNETYFDAGSGKNLYVFLTEYTGSTHPDDLKPYVLYKMDLNEGMAAWDNRTLVMKMPTSNDRIVSFEASLSNFFVFAVRNTASIESVSVYAMDEVEHPLPGLKFHSPVENKIYSQWIAVSPSGAFDRSTIVTCGTDTTTGANYLAIHRVGFDQPDTMYRVTNSETTNGCAGAYNIDDEGRIVFYRTTNDATTGEPTSPQLSFIDLSKIKSGDLILDSGMATVIPDTSSESSK